MPVNRRCAAARRISGLFGFALVLASALAGGPINAAGATAAQSEPSPFTVHIDRPPEETFTGSASVTVSGKVVTTGIGAGLDRIRVQVVRQEDGATVVDTNLCCNSPRGGETAFGPYSTPALAYNGPYRVTVTASGYYDILISRSAAPPASASRSFSMAVPADPPTGVKAQLVGERNVQVSWTAPSYPADFIGFAVFRKVGNGSFEPLRGLAKGETSFTDTGLGTVVGTVQYQVASVRQGAQPGSDPSKWLVSRSEATAALTLPPLATTVPPGGSTTTTAPGGGLQPDGAASADLGSFFSSVPTVELPPPSPPPTFPDTGFSELLPFPATSSTAPGGESGRPSVRTPVSSDEVLTETEDVTATNRRALLVPVAAGSVLCVAALHLRWLNKRLAIVPPAEGAGEAAAADGFDFDLDDDGGYGEDSFLPPREPVGAGPRGPARRG